MKKKKHKIIKTYLLVGILNFIQFFIKQFKRLAHKIYSNIDWKYYNEIDRRIYDKFKDKFKKYYSMDN